MWKQFVKDYLRFNKGERRAVLVLLALVLLILVLPWCWPAPKPVMPDKKMLEQLKRQMAEKPRVEAREAGEHTIRSPSYPSATSVNTKRFSGRLFYFDPNTLPEAGLKELGLRDKTIQTIQHYREKGGRFQRPEDLGKIYGLYPDEYARLLPYVKIEQPLSPARTAGKAEKAGTAGKEYSAPSTVSYTKRGSSVSYPRKTTTPHGIEINAADTLSLMTLPGIGERLAGRIVRFRDKLGGFYSVEQVGETYALPDSVFQQVKILLRCDSNALRRLDINTADVNTLRQHPYIGWNIANAIVEYRRQHGDYKSMDDLQKIDIISPELFRKLKPYLTILPGK